MQADAGAMLRDPDEVIRALTRLRDVLNPRSRSILFVGATNGAERDPFHPAFLVSIEARAELVRRLRLLQPRDRLLLFLWYVEGWPPTEVARHLGISRVHCYRLRNRALARLTDPEPSARRLDPSSGSTVTHGLT
jgi:DNA-directed RNA polymerase specialized sigma24 family protein